MISPVAEYEAATRGPGAFEGERRYVPYFWDMYLNGFADRDNGSVLGFQVTAEDREQFPELAGRKWVRLFVTDQGFIVEC